MRIFTLILFLAGCCVATAQTTNPLLITNISSTNLVEGEVATLNFIYRGSNPLQAPPAEIPAEGLLIKQRDYHQQFANGTRYFIYEYVVFAQQSGSFEIPSLDLEFKGKTIKSEPATVNVRPFSTLKKERFKHNDSEIACYSTAFTSKKELYPGESAQVEYKIYIPTKLNPQGWGLPKPDVTDNCTAWRFQPPASNRHVGQAIFDNQQYSVATYTTVLSSIKPGKVTFGPLATDLIIAPSSINSRFGFTRRQTAELPITSSALSFDVLEFPTSPPSEFNGAVGEFTVEADIPAKESMSLNDSITATVTIKGSGNLPDIIAPELEDTATWKVVDVSKVQQGDERKELNGQTQFTYILQPQRGADALPRFTFAHFNPSAQEFFVETTATTPITITIPSPSGSSSAVLNTADVPQEKMQDILGPIINVRINKATPNKLSQLPVWTWQTLPAASLIILLLYALINRVKRQKNGSVEQQARKVALKKLAETDDSSFLKLAGSYAEHWLENDSALKKEILTQRDSQCYQPAHNQGINNQLRQSILGKLKKLTLLVSVSLLTLSSPADANEKAFAAWESGDYQSALELYLKESQQTPNSADLLFNVGNSYYRTDQPGMAALYYAKALKLDPKHYEAAKNLSFIQKLNGSLRAPESSPWKKQITRLPAETYRQIALGLCWLLLLSLLSIKLLSLKKGRFILAVVMSSLSPLFAIASISCWWLHPERITENKGDAGIVTQYTAVLTEPIDFTGKELEQKTMIQAPAGSPCRILATRGNWIYIELANSTRGWVSKQKVGTI